MTYQALLTEALKLPPAERARLAEALRAGGVNAAGEGGAAEGPSLYDLMKQQGLLVDHDPDRPLPSDLSTNPKHMEGFGRDK